MKILGIDLGLKRTGLAVSDQSGEIVRRLSNLEAKNQLQALTIISQLCIDLDIQIIVIGLPKKSTSNEALVKRINSLHAILPAFLESKNIFVKVYLFDESYTSKIAAKNLVYNNTPKNKRKKMLDSESACVLIEEFFYWYKNEK